MLKVRRHVPAGMGLTRWCSRHRPSLSELSTQSHVSRMLSVVQMLLDYAEAAKALHLSEDAGP